MDEIHSASGSMSLKEASLTEPSKANQSESNLQNSEAVNANSNIGKGTTLPTTKGTENSTDGTCDNAEKAPIRRLSPEGAECNAVDAQMTDAAGDTSGYLTVPGKKVVRTQRRDFVGSPSGHLDVKNYWLSDDVVEGTEKLHSYTSPYRSIHSLTRNQHSNSSIPSCCILASFPQLWFRPQEIWEQNLIFKLNKKIFVTSFLLINNAIYTKKVSSKARIEHKH